MNYTIRSGETLSGIARANGITQKALEKANMHITDPDVIQAGEVITIPDDAVLVSGTSDPATNAAIIASTKPVDSVVEDCPLRDEWFTVKPMRYGVAEADSPLQLADTLTMGVSMPTLSQHKYIARELIDHTVYLYNEQEGYLLEVLYKAAIAQDARCVFGEPPSEVMAALPIIKQKRGAVATLWLTIAPLAESHLSNLTANPDMIADMGQGIDFSQAAKGSAPDTRPLYDLQNLLAEIQTHESTLKWTIPTLEPVSDINGVMVPYQAQTPDNHYAVCLVDAVGITTDLCREFSAAYEIVMQSVSSAQHPHHMATLTRSIIDKEMSIAQTRVPTEYVNHREGYSTPYSEEDIEKRRQDVSQSAKEGLEKYLHTEEMDQYLADYEQAIPGFKNDLDALADDWIAWLDDEHLDLALSWLDDAQVDQMKLKESLVAAMVNNIDATDQGVALREKWIDYLFSQTEGEPQEGADAGVAAHVLLSVGFVQKTILAGSKWLKTFSDTRNGPNLDAIAQSRSALYESQQLPATDSTDVIVQSVAGRVAQRSIADNQPITWEAVHTAMVSRYGYQYSKVKARFADVLYDVEASHAATVAVVTNNSAQSPKKQFSLKQAIVLYDLEQATTTNTAQQGKVARYLEAHSRFWAKQMIGNGMLDDNTRLMKAYRATESSFTRPRMHGVIGMFWAVQVYNAFQVSSELEKTRGVIKSVYITFNAYIAVVNSSFAAIDHFAGTRFGQSGSKLVFTKYMETQGAEYLGKGLSTAVKLKLEQIDVLNNKLIEQAEKLGKGVTTLVKGSFKSLPVIGAVLGVMGSGYQLNTDNKSGQNGWAMALSGTSLLLNSAAVMFALAALFPVGAPVAAVMAVVLGIAALSVEILRACFVDSETQLMLKKSFWGNGEYRYAPDLDTGMMSERLGFYQQTIQTKEMVRSIHQEMKAFCDFLFKPMPIIRNYRRDNQYSYFDLDIVLPGFIPLTSDVSLHMQGVTEHHKQDLLVSDTHSNRWKTNKLDGKIELLNSTTAQVSLNVDERALNQDYIGFTLALDYHGPAGYPVILKYRHIEIDDNNKLLGLFRSEAELNEFKLSESSPNEPMLSELS